MSESTPKHVTYGFLPVRLLNRDRQQVRMGFIKAEMYPDVVSQCMSVYVIDRRFSSEGITTTRTPATYVEQYVPPVFSQSDIDELP